MTSDQLPHLVELLEDDDPQVLLTVIKELTAYGPTLVDELRNIKPPLDEAKILLIQWLIDDYRESLTRGLTMISEELVDSSIRVFRTGQLVRHKRYGYRGVVVHADESCQADEEWYRSNRTRPNKDQPWYHVLVHMSNQVTYAAESSLEPDPSEREVVHPFLKYFFASFEKGLYQRNSRPWPDV